MFNYHNLNDVEFEHLCKDIMEKKLDTILRIFAKGRDGGIDLTDNVANKNLVIQVKHYINSTYSNLKISLKKEIPKVKELNPKKYYICCGKELTAANINEIYKMFSNYMESDSNIITLKEIDNFLQDKNNEEIVRKNYKLWLHASGILNQILNQDIFIDCESLLCDIEDESKFFVQTRTYNKCLERLLNHRIIMMVGAPGVGKTITSKMLILYFAQLGYKVRYTTNGDISDLKKSLSSNKNAKEIVLLDDCLGQHYFNMKSTQEQELISLIKYIHINFNKLLIMNSRITIFNEAKERSEEFHIIIEGEKVVLHAINMDTISLIEKAKILYNHLKYKNVPPTYYEDIRKDKGYLRIVNHRNYTPRIIEYITLESRLTIVESDQYFKYCMDKLDKPNDIWKNEFERRLTNIDRAFMSTLYSLTETLINIDVLKICFNKRLESMNGIDNTINHFELTLNRLNSAMISIYDYKDTKHIGVINPSVNDYLKLVFSVNGLELQSVRNAIVYDIQIERCYGNEEHEKVMLELLECGELLELRFVNDYKRDYFIISYICKYHILDSKYSIFVNDFLLGKRVFNNSFLDLLAKDEIYKQILSQDMRKFYKLDLILLDIELLEKVFESLYVEELVLVGQVIFEILVSEEQSDDFIEEYIWLCSEVINTQLSNYIDDIDPLSIYEEYDISDLLQDNIKYNKYGPEINYNEIRRRIENWVVDDIDEDIGSLLSLLPHSISKEIKVKNIGIELDTMDIESMVDLYLEPMDYNEDGYMETATHQNFDAIEAIFERE